MTEFTSEFITNWKHAIKVVVIVRGDMREVEKFALEALDEIERLQARVQELEAEIKESNDLLRSAFMIAKRDGRDTNWEAWHNQLSVALARQHAMMYGKDEK